MTYNVYVGGVEGNPQRLHKVLGVIAEQSPDVFGLQETKVVRGTANELVHALRQQGDYPYDQTILEGDIDLVSTTGSAIYSRRKPTRSRIVGERVKAVEMSFPIPSGELSVANVYLSHVDEAARLPQIREVLQELSGQQYGIIIGDFNALSPQDGLVNGIIPRFTPRMVEKYTRDGKLCYDTVEAVLEAGYVDVGLQFHRPSEITDMTDINGPNPHAIPIRMDFIFAKQGVLPHVTGFELVNQGLARVASDHFPWNVTLDDRFAGEYEKI